MKFNQIGYADIPYAIWQIENFDEDAVAVLGRRNEKRRQYKVKKFYILLVFGFRPMKKYIATDQLTIVHIIQLKVLW